jgi:polar amino acid transport system substrate-binding protein
MKRAMYVPVIAIGLLLSAIFYFSDKSDLRIGDESDSVNGEVVGKPIEPLPEPAAPPTPNPDCKGLKPEASYPADATATGPGLDRIKQRGKLIVGVSADTLLFGARNPFNGRLEGLDTDLLRQLATTIFGSNNNDEHIQFRVITYAARLPLLESGAIDAVAHTMTINCARWNRIAFSSEYYRAGQQILVKATATAEKIEDLPVKSRICVPSGGTSVDTLKGYTANDFVPVEVDDITECLVIMQQGGADAVLSDDTVVKGMARQDPYVKVVGGLLSQEPYGIGFNANNTYLVQVANAMLDTLRTNGGMDKILADNQLPTGTTPTADSSRPLSSEISAIEESPVQETPEPPQP